MIKMSRTTRAMQGRRAEYFGTEKLPFSVPRIRTVVAAIDECNLGTRWVPASQFVVVFRLLCNDKQSPMTAGRAFAMVVVGVREKSLARARSEKRKSGWQRRCAPGHHGDGSMERGGREYSDGQSVCLGCWQVLVVLVRPGEIRWERIFRWPGSSL
jgi:hypothetical protein